MAAFSGLWPQNRVTKDADCEEILLSVNPNAAVDSRSAGDFRNLESFKNLVPVRHDLVPSLKTVRILSIIFFTALVCTGVLIYGSGVLFLQSNRFGRQCANFRDRSQAPETTYKFAMVTCSDGSKSIPHRSFEGLNDLVMPNKESYVHRHGYDFIDASDLLDKSRPPSWSKILAVKEHLSKYDYVFWNDADSIVTNPSTTLEDIIHDIAGDDAHWDDMPDLILTEDVTGVNAGMFFVRNSEWSRRFLDLWWSQTSFIQPFGHSKSGDNDALKYLIATMPEAENERHIRIAQMQCAFNSYLWRPTWKNSGRLVTMTKAIWRGAYGKGDFMLHLAGLDDKKKWVEKVLEDINKDSAWSSGITENRAGHFMSRKAGPSKSH